MKIYIVTVRESIHNKIGNLSLVDPNKSNIKLYSKTYPRITLYPPTLKQKEVKVRVLDLLKRKILLEI